jgi:iron complex transport system substrate-binding protein
LEDLSIPVAYVEFENIDQIYRDLRIFAEILNEDQRGEELISSYQMYYQQIQDKLKNINAAEKPTVLILQAESEDQKYIFKVPATNWLQTDMVEKSGGIAVWKEANLGSGWTEVNIEQVSNWDADLVYIVNYQGQAPEIVRNLKNDEIWKNLNATQGDRIFAFAYDFLSWDQPDPRWILGYSWMALKQNPQSISENDIQNLIRDYYQKFFNLGESVFEEKINPMVMEYFN